MRYSQQGIMQDTPAWTKMIAAGAVAVVLAVSAIAQSYAASAPLLCFQGTGDGYGSNGTCVMNADGVSAVVNTVDSDSDSNNAYGGVYYETSSLTGKTVGQVDALSFSYNGTGAAGGSPRITLPIDKDGDGVTDSYISMDTLGCNDGDANVGTVDVVHDQTCVVSDNATGESFVNWADYVAAHPTYVVSSDAIPFVVVDQPGQFTLSNVVIGSQATNSNVVINKDQCKANGWKNVVTADGKGFKNQGQCVAYVQSSANSKHHRSTVE